MSSWRAALVPFLLLIACAFAQDASRGALERAKPGQWVLYKMQNDMAMKQSIVKVDGKKITIKNEMWIKGQALPTNETPIDIEKKVETNEKSTKTEKARTEEGELTINGHVLKCRIVTQGQVKTWISDDVPVTGIVRQEMNGKLTLEVQGYGNAPDEDRLKKS